MIKFLFSTVVFVYLSTVISAPSMAKIADLNTEALKTTIDDTLNLSSITPSMDSLNVFNIAKVNTTSDTSGKVQYNYDEEKTPVHPKDLPVAVKSSLSTEEYKGWKTTSARFVKPAKGSSYYEIALLKEQNSKVAKFKGNGKIL